MASATHTDSRTEHLIELMTKGDDAFNARDWDAVDTVHHPHMVAYVTGLAEPIYGSEAHSAQTAGGRPLGCAHRRLRNYYARTQTIAACKCR